MNWKEYVCYQANQDQRPILISIFATYDDGPDRLAPTETDEVCVSYSLDFNIEHMKYRDLYVRFDWIQFRFGVTPTSVYSDATGMIQKLALERLTISKV